MSSKGRHNLKRDFYKKYCFWDFKNFIIFFGVFLKFFSSHKKDTAVLQAIVAIMTTFGHKKKESYKKNAVIQAIVAIVTTIGHTSNTISNEILKFFFLDF